MPKALSRRSGFTLPEVLVTVAIIAVLAAAVVPTVVNQLGKGEVGNVASDLNALANAVTSFVADTRKYPGDMEDLLNKPDATDAVLGGIAGSYSVAAINAWKGPYLATTQDVANDDYVFGGLNLTAANALVAPAAGNGYHITLTITPTAGSFTEQALLAIDQALDGGNGSFTAAGTCVATNPNAEGGRLTWAMTGTSTAIGDCLVTAGSVRYRLVPTGS